MAQLAATSRIAAHRSAIKLDFSISHDRNSVLILCIIVVAVVFGQGSILLGGLLLPWQKKKKKKKKTATWIMHIIRTLF